MCLFGHKGAGVFVHSWSKIKIKVFEHGMSRSEEKRAEDASEVVIKVESRV